MTAFCFARTKSINAPFTHQPDDFFNNNNRKIYVHIDLVFTIFGDARAVNIVVVVISMVDTICRCRGLSTLRCEYN